MNFQTHLKASAVQIDKLLEKYLNKNLKEAVGLDANFSPYYQAFIEANKGGKRLRGYLVNLGYEIFSKKQNTEILKISVAFELFQTAVLAHDDIIDQSLTRRNSPTLHIKLGGDHHAISQTICLGDLGFFQAVKIISETNFSDLQKNQAINLFSQMSINTIYGEILDIELPFLNQKITEEKVITVSRLKTAYYSLVYPLKIGAVIAGADSANLDALKVFGENLGIAYQIKDDILGLFGDEKDIGKSVTSDAEEGKATLLYLHALKKSNKSQKEILKKYYGKKKLSGLEMNKLKKVFLDTGALEYSEKKAQEYVTKSIQVIPKITKNKKMQNLLTELADFLINRTK